MNSIRGFTLIELMIVVVIIGILAAIAIPKYGDVSEAARRNACRANMRTITGQQAIFAGANARYANDLAELGMTGVQCPAGVSYNFDVPSSESFNISCPEGHGQILNGVASWVDSGE